MGMACSMHGRDEKCIQNFDPKTLGKRPLEDLVIDVGILKQIIEKKLGRFMWFRDQWKALVTVIMNIWVP
jgi:hypothetical protein